MDLIAHLRRQFTYDAWANREVLATISDCAKPMVRPRQLLAHILSAERLWLERIRNQPPSFPVWPEFSNEEIETQISDLDSQWREYFVSVSSTALSENVSYKNSKGELWTSTVEDILTHILLHSAYHRGQIASRMRAEGEQPAATDFIHAARKKLFE